MNETNQHEVWQVEVGGRVYEAPFGDLPVWIEEGSLLPEDKVRKGNLRWIEARRVPSLVPFFNAKADGVSPTLIATTNSVVSPETNPSSPEPAPAPPSSVTPTQPAATPNISGPKAQATSPGSCSLHPDLPSGYVCDGCGAHFCKGCPNAYGSVRICPSCGSFCSSMADAVSKVKKSSRSSAAISEGFGFSDFGNAIAHPFRFIPSLLIGGFMFMLFTLGQSAAGMGSIFLAVAALFCVLLANMLTFGVLANTVDSFVKGDLDADFMPSFEDFSIWTDVLHPFFLSIGVYITSFGPFAVTLLIGFYLIMSSITSQSETVQSDLEKIPGTQYYSARETAQQSEEVKKVLADIAANRAIQQTQVAEGVVPQAPVDQETLDQEALWENVQQSRRKQLESTFGTTDAAQEMQAQQVFSSFLRLAAPLVVISAITLLWGLFYFPAACAVAGYTRSLMATLNPLIGLDTIKRLGLDYAKILMMGIILLIASGLVSAFLAVIFSPFDMPRVGNLPATAVGAFFAFYFTAVFSCIIGYAMFKASDRLKLPR